MKDTIRVAAMLWVALQSAVLLGQALPDFVEVTGVDIYEEGSLSRPDEEARHQFVGSDDYGPGFKWNDAVPVYDPLPLGFNAMAPRDRERPFTLGVSPATLAPEGMDLDIFPEFPLSDELSVKPSLAYAVDSFLVRLGFLGYGGPKRWQNHYGELIRMVARTDGMKEPLGERIPTSCDSVGEGKRLAVPVELQTYFINAAGQEVSFYPDPDDYDDNDDNDEGVSNWFSDDGRYWLHLDSTGKFTIKTRQGLRFEFEKYDYFVDGEKEAIALRYRVNKILDRYENFIVVEYKSENCIRPNMVKGYEAGDTPNSNPDLDPYKQRIEYVYESEGLSRLKKIRVPKNRNNTDRDIDAVNEYELWYPDEDSTLYGCGAAGYTTESGHFESMLSGVDVYVDDNAVYLDLSAHERLSKLLTQLDFHGHDEPATGSNVVWILRFQSDSTSTYFKISSEQGRIQNKFGQGCESPIRYRYQMDWKVCDGNSGPRSYPDSFFSDCQPAYISGSTSPTFIEQYPDRITVSRVSGPPPQLWNSHDGIVRTTKKRRHLGEP